MTWLSIYSIYLEKMNLRPFVNIKIYLLHIALKTYAGTFLQQTELNFFYVHFGYIIVSYLMSSYMFAQC